MAGGNDDTDDVVGGPGQPEGPPVVKQKETEPAPIGDAEVLVIDRILDEVRDALELAEYVIKHGTKRSDGNSLPRDTLLTIKATAGKVRLFEHDQAVLEAKAINERGLAVAEPVQNARVYIKASDWTSFELAYYTLAEFSDPVTIETLRDTRATGKDGGSPAQKFTHLLWWITGVFALAVLIGGVITTGAEGASRSTWFRTLDGFVPIFVPWTYGGLGACAYLLRTAHDMIAKRCFDVRRQPEYFNRILLGMVSGGAIVLLVSPSGDDEAVKISAAALGFLAGYSNDLLFNAVERVTAALLPKIGLETVQKERLAPRQIEVPVGGLTIESLMDKMDKADKEDKELYRSLIEKLRDRL